MPWSQRQGNGNPATDIRDISASPRTGAWCRWPRISPPHVKPDARRALVFEKPRTPGGLFRKEVVRFRVLLDPDIDPSGPTWDGFADMMAEIPRDEWGWEVQ
ncbi:hypothetical protein JCM17960_26520 [Magnetospira thiophila]